MEDLTAENPEPIMTAAEYSESVNKWLQQAYQWQYIALGKIEETIHEFKAF